MKRLLLRIAVWLGKADAVSLLECEIRTILRMYKFMVETNNIEPTMQMVEALVWLAYGINFNSDCTCKPHTAYFYKEHKKILYDLCNSYCLVLADVFECIDADNQNLIIELYGEYTKLMTQLK